MDLQRILLFGAIIVLSFMLLTEWVAFKEARAPSAAQQSPRILSGAETGSAETARPGAASGTTADEDLPTAPAEPGATVPSAETTEGAGRRMVQVHTDTLQLVIDLDGGDIIELALPRHLAELDDPDTPFVLLEQNSTRTYVSQSGLIGPDGIDRQGRARFTAASSRYELEEGRQTLAVDLKWRNDAEVEITKRFTFHRGDYLIEVEYLVDNGSDARWQANLFGQIKRDGSPAPSAADSGMGIKPFLGAAITQPDERFTKFSFEDIAEEPFRKQLPGGWIAMLQHYFLSAWIPAPEQSHTYSTRMTSSGFYIAGFTSAALVLDPGQAGSVSARFYAGPKDQYRLEEISQYLDLSVDYGWLWWIAQPLFWLLTKMHALVGNWGARSPCARC